VGIEKNIQALSIARSSPTATNISFAETDFMTVNAEGARYDLIISAFTFHHFPLTEALNKAKSMLNPGGRIVHP